MSGTIRITRGYPAMTAIPMDAIEDPELSFAAKGLFAYLHTLPEGTPVSGQALAPTAAGAKAIDVLLTELEAFGYLEDLTDLGAD